MGGIRKVMVLVGTRPEVLKMAPVVMELRRRPQAECLLVSTGQHREMLAQALSVFALEPDEDLKLMRENQELAGRCRMVLVTAHRRESFGEAFERMCRAMLHIVERICGEAEKLLANPDEYERRSRIANPYGDGKAAGRIVELLT